ncbi:NAD(P)H-dependent flavin oxidoreductase [Faecalibacter bovis]|uniref:Nitronate monooxygenase n=1 Tax=Faecalibacter bovis TaxID=2898187 RepID=A0ABX7XD22_9FLAO|nr:nitronate monooxygenase family protein [Faecalibacter bovis]QTV05745.1 nitronate monooxygenase [Faecalibacter bovis]
MTINEFKQSLEIPVISSPMFLVSRTELVIEACKNGICGTFPSLNGRTSEDFENMLIEITTELNKFEVETGKKAAPFGVNIIVNHTNPRIQPDLELCAKYKVPLIITSLGAVKDIVNAVHAYGGLVFHDVIKKRHAEKAAEAGVDGIIAVAAGAGGHAGTSNPFALIADIKSVYNGPIILAGCLNTGNDVAAALAMGAEFAYMGTRFIATKEGNADDAYKKMIVDSTLEDIIYTPHVSGVNANFLTKSLVLAGVDMTEVKEEDFSKLNDNGQKAWKNIWSAGHGVSGIHDIPTTKELIGQIKAEYKAVLLKNKEELDKLKY